MVIRTHRRAGFSLTEALIAIFCVAIGLMGILVLFPIGALQMAQAIKDDRSAQGNHTATTRMRQFWRDEVFKPALPPKSPYTFQYRDPYVNAMNDVNAPYTNPPYAPPYTNGGNPAASVVPIPYQSNLPLISQYWTGPTYPVYLDPMGWNNPNNVAAGPQKYWLAGQIGCIPRRSLMLVQAQPSILQGWFIQTDDQAFGRDGTPAYLLDPNGATSSGTLQYASNTGTSFAAMQNQVNYDGRYSWAYLLRRDRSINWDQSELSVVVYGGRSLDGPSNETAYGGVTFTKGATEVVLPYNGARPNIRKGGWILDATMYNPYYPLPAGSSDPHGFFYRVVNVNDDTPGVLYLEIQSPAQLSTWNNIQGVNQSPYGVLVTMDYVVEVFERKTLTKVIVPVP